MELDNFEAVLSAWKNERPFQPFVVSLVNGNKFEVDFPDALSLRNGVAVYIGPRNVPVFFDHQSVSEFVRDLLHREEAA